MKKGNLENVIDILNDTKNEFDFKQLFSFEGLDLNLFNLVLFGKNNTISEERKTKFIQDLLNVTVRIVKDYKKILLDNKNNLLINVIKSAKHTDNTNLIFDFFIKLEETEYKLKISDLENKSHENIFECLAKSELTSEQKFQILEKSNTIEAGRNLYQKDIYSILNQFLLYHKHIDNKNLIIKIISDCDLRKFLNKNEILENEEKYLKQKQEREMVKKTKIKKDFIKKFTPHPSEILINVPSQINFAKILEILIKYKLFDPFILYRDTQESKTKTIMSWILKKQLNEESVSLIVKYLLEKEKEDCLSLTRNIYGAQLIYINTYEVLHFINKFCGKKLDFFADLVCKLIQLTKSQLLELIDKEGNTIINFISDRLVKDKKTSVSASTKIIFSTECIEYLINLKNTLGKKTFNIKYKEFIDYINKLENENNTTMILSCLFTNEFSLIEKYYHIELLLSELSIPKVILLIDLFKNPEFLLQKFIMKEYLDNENNQATFFKGLIELLYIFLPINRWAYSFQIVNIILNHFSQNIKNWFKLPLLNRISKFSKLEFSSDRETIKILKEYHNANSVLKYEFSNNKNHGLIDIFLILFIYLDDDESYFKKLKYYIDLYAKIKNIDNILGMKIHKKDLKQEKLDEPLNKDNLAKTIQLLKDSFFNSNYISPPNEIISINNMYLTENNFEVFKKIKNLLKTQIHLEIIDTLFSIAEASSHNCFKPYFKLTIMTLSNIFEKDHYLSYMEAALHNFYDVVCPAWLIKDENSKKKCIGKENQILLLKNNIFSLPSYSVNFGEVLTNDNDLFILSQIRSDFKDLHFKDTNDTYRALSNKKTTNLEVKFISRFDLLISINHFEFLFRNYDPFTENNFSIVKYLNTILTKNPNKKQKILLDLPLNFFQGPTNSCLTALTCNSSFIISYNIFAFLLHETESRSKQDLIANVNYFKEVNKVYKQAGLSCDIFSQYVQENKENFIEHILKIKISLFTKNLELFLNEIGEDFLKDFLKNKSFAESLSLILYYILLKSYDSYINEKDVFKLVKIFLKFTSLFDYHNFYNSKLLLITVKAFSICSKALLNASQEHDIARVDFFKIILFPKNEYILYTKLEDIISMICSIANDLLNAKNIDYFNSFARSLIRTCNKDNLLKCIFKYKYLKQLFYSYFIFIDSVEDFKLMDTIIGIDEKETEFFTDIFDISQNFGFSQISKKNNSFAKFIARFNNTTLYYLAILNNSEEVLKDILKTKISFDKITKNPNDVLIKFPLKTALIISKNFNLILEFFEVISFSESTEENNYKIICEFYRVESLYSTVIKSFKEYFPDFEIEKLYKDSIKFDNFILAKAIFYDYIDKLEKLLFYDLKTKENLILLLSAKNQYEMLFGFLKIIKQENIYYKNKMYTKGEDELNPIEIAIKNKSYDCFLVLFPFYKKEELREFDIKIFDLLEHFSKLKYKGFEKFVSNIDPVNYINLTILSNLYENELVANVNYKFVNTNLYEEAFETKKKSSILYFIFNYIFFEDTINPELMTVLQKVDNHKFSWLILDTLIRVLGFDIDQKIFENLFENQENFITPTLNKCENCYLILLSIMETNNKKIFSVNKYLSERKIILSTTPIDKNIFEKYPNYDEFLRNRKYSYEIINPKYTEIKENIEKNILVFFYNITRSNFKILSDIVSEEFNLKNKLSQIADDPFFKNNSHTYIIRCLLSNFNILKYQFLNPDKIIFPVIFKTLPRLSMKIDIDNINDKAIKDLLIFNDFKEQKNDNFIELDKEHEINFAAVLLNIYIFDQEHFTELITNVISNDKQNNNIEIYLNLFTRFKFLIKTILEKNEYKDFFENTMKKQTPQIFFKHRNLHEKLFNEIFYELLKDSLFVRFFSFDYLKSLHSEITKTNVYKKNLENCKTRVTDYEKFFAEFSLHNDIIIELLTQIINWKSTNKSILLKVGQKYLLGKNTFLNTFNHASKLIKLTNSFEKICRNFLIKKIKIDLTYLCSKDLREAKNITVKNSDILAKTIVLLFETNFYQEIDNNLEKFSINIPYYFDKEGLVFREVITDMNLNEFVENLYQNLFILIHSSLPHETDISKIQHTFLTVYPKILSVISLETKENNRYKTQGDDELLKDYIVDSVWEAQLSYQNKGFTLKQYEELNTLKKAIRNTINITSGNVGDKLFNKFIIFVYLAKANFNPDENEINALIAFFIRECENISERMLGFIMENKHLINRIRIFLLNKKNYEFRPLSEYLTDMIYSKTDSLDRIDYNIFFSANNLFDNFKKEINLYLIFTKNIFEQFQPDVFTNTTLHLNYSSIQKILIEAIQQNSLNNSDNLQKACFCEKNVLNILIVEEIEKQLKIKKEINIEKLTIIIDFVLSDEKNKSGKEQNNNNNNNLIHLGLFDRLFEITFIKDEINKEGAEVIISFYLYILDNNSK